jgi:hypothetical protein
VATANQNNRDLLERLRPHISDHEHVVIRAALHAHEHPVTKNVNEVERGQRSTGQMMADKITATGSTQA